MKGAGVTAPMAVLFGRRTRTARLARGWTFRDLEDKSGVSREVINRVELGRTDTSWSRAIAIADALGLSLDDLAAPSSCTVCDGMPPPGMTCNSCGKGTAGAS